MGYEGYVEVVLGVLRHLMETHTDEEGTSVMTQSK